MPAEIGQNPAESPQNPEKPEIVEIVSRLSLNQLKFVAARQHFPTDKAAAEAIDLSPATVYNWPLYVKQAVKLVALHNIEAVHVIDANLFDTVLVKAEGLYSDDERIRQAAATEIIDRVLGKPGPAPPRWDRGEHVIQMQRITPPIFPPEAYQRDDDGD